MDRTQVINRWIESAKENVAVAKDMYRLKHYSWCLFMWHLALEKTLKAYITSKNKEVPYIHDLFKLSKYAEFQLNKAYITKADLDEITSFNLEARYEDYKFSFYKKASSEYTNKWVPVCEEFYRQILQELHETN